MKKQFLLSSLYSMMLLSLAAQKKLDILQVPGLDRYCTINEKGESVLPSGRLLTPAGELVRITNDPFGMAISPDGKKAVTLHNGVFTVIDLQTLEATRVPGYNQQLNSRWHMIPECLAF
jgi:hypothetical protein